MRVLLRFGSGVYSLPMMISFADESGKTRTEMTRIESCQHTPTRPLLTRQPPFCFDFLPITSFLHPPLHSPIPPRHASPPIGAPGGHGGHFRLRLRPEEQAERDYKLKYKGCIWENTEVSCPEMKCTDNSSAVPTSTLPRLSAVLGPTPPSAPLNLARWVVQVSSLPPFESSLPRAGAEAGIREKEDTATATPAVPHTRALIITGPRATYHASLEDEDEPHLRGVARTDARVDVRYCPSARHARLLLALLSSSGAAACADTGAGRAGSASAGGSESGLARVYDIPLPSVVILHDLLGLFEENDENRPPGTGPFAA
jgi:hypothetical protein